MLPCPPKKPEGMQGANRIMLLLWAWAVYFLCKIMVGVIKRMGLIKSKEAANEIGRITPQSHRQIPHTNKEELKEPMPNDGQEAILTGTTGTMTTSADTKLGADKIQWVSTRQWEKLDGATNTIIGDIRKAIYDEFNDNVRRFMVNKYSGS